MTRKWQRILARIPGYDPIATAGDCEFDPDAADLALAFFPQHLHHVKGKWRGDPFELERWQQAIVANAFGWKRPDGTRRYRRVWIEVPRKNGKSTFAAGLVLYMLFVDQDPGSELYSAAADREQAALVFDQAKGMVRQNEQMSALATVYTRAIALNDGSGSYKTVSADVRASWGKNTQFAVIDEVHALPNSELIDSIETSTGARAQPMIVYITTRDYDRPSPCNELEKYALAVREQRYADKAAQAFLPAMWLSEKGDDWHSPKVWARVNPNLGVSVGRDYIRERHEEALARPTYENTFKRLHLNLKTEQAERWIVLEQWDACGSAVDASELEGKPCVAGLDLSSTQDVTAFVLYFPEDGGVVLPYFWVPAESADERERKDRVPYVAWAREGLVELTEGSAVDQERVYERVKEIAGRYDLRDVGFDRWGSEWIKTRMMEDGIPVTEFGQGYASMSEPTKGLERLLVSGRIRHGGHPVLRWMAGNVAVLRDPAGNIKPSKQHSADRIDGIVALIMAIGRAGKTTEKPARSVYEERGAVVV